MKKSKKEKKQAIKDANSEVYSYSKDPTIQQEPNQIYAYNSGNMNYQGAQPIAANNVIGMQPMGDPNINSANIQMGVPVPVDGNNMNVVVVQNQVDPEEMLPNFRSSPIKTICPYCNTQIRTYVETHLNCLNLCCYCWTSCIVWTAFQLCRGKDLSCSDARHFCPKCGKTLGYYEAC
ncbi:MAG: LITAF-like zinc ribbon domain-containing protein [archaeon]|nr:LITAF-like zinc ribbon domain-containing protein [archaeon]